ncbi:MAG: peptidoglycan DD-metalloendopeptidase family protein [Candidatus Hydrogenedentes bacterium]|nr:peptidoglycan DD-metalloendopeptidase family protein [Candidatus Hydrogenedentota bacterium]
MVIKPVIPAKEPELGEASSLRTLPFRRDSGFVEMLKAAQRATTATPPKPHEVKSGESLWRICEDALRESGAKPNKSDINAAVQRVTAANNLKNANVLSVGQRLDIAAAYGAVTSPPITKLSAPAKSGPVPPLVPDSQPVLRPLTVKNDGTAESHPARPNFAALAPRRGDAMGGPLTTRRPLFQRLSNARPMIHNHVLENPSKAGGVDAGKSVDLTALMQSILEPGSVKVEAETPAGPWSKLLGTAGRFTSGYGVRSDPFSGKPQFHQGIDIAAAAGTEIFPYMPGTVKSAGWDAGHGYNVVVEHPNGMETVYAHASETLVKAGDVVMKDTPIAKVGSTGRSTGPHLHFEVRQNDKSVDPMPFIKQDSLDIAKAL